MSATVSEYVNARQPFDAAADCPACGARRPFVSYSGQRMMRTPSGWVSVHHAGEGFDHHLIVRCGPCGFEWEMEVAQP